MSLFDRTDTSIIGRWWWTVDRWTLIAVSALIAIGAVLMLAASPAVATRIGVDNFHFVKRQLALAPIALLAMFVLSLLEVRTIRRIGAVGFLLGLMLLPLTFMIGPEIKGAKRWIDLGFTSLQPSEFVKPCFAVVIGWMLAERHKRAGFPGYFLATLFLVITVGLLLMQPDLGMVVMICAIWFTEFFLAGLPVILVALLGVSGVAGLIGAYFLFPHVASRIDRFLDPATGDRFQVERALDAFANGGAWGRGPGEGLIKRSVPDAHADFIFAVAGEEFGLALCLVIVALFAFVVLRGFSRLLHESDLFILLSGAGLLTQFGLQALINMASTLSLIPTKGMTLPFISYGGSSLVALGMGMGMILALTQRRFGMRGVQWTSP